MNASSQIKSLCEELINPATTDDQLIKGLQKMLILLKTPDKNQKELFLGLSDKGLHKLTTLIKDQREQLRKLSFKILIDLLYGNEVLQNIFCEKFNFNPIGNVICINWLPNVMKEKIPIDSRVIVDIKKCQNVSEKNSPTRYWKWPNNEKYTDDDIPDPERYLLGFFFSNKTTFVFENKGEGITNEEKVKIIDLIEEGYVPEPMMDKEMNGPGVVGQNKQQKLKEDYKKNKIKNPSKSIDFKQPGGKYKK